MLRGSQAGQAKASSGARHAHWAPKVAKQSPDNKKAKPSHWLGGCNNVRASLLRRQKVPLLYALPRDGGHHENGLGKAVFCLALSTSTFISNSPYNGTRTSRTSNIQNLHLKRLLTMESLQVCCLATDLNLEKHFTPCLTLVAHCSKLTLQFGCLKHTLMK